MNNKQSISMIMSLIFFLIYLMSHEFYWGDIMVGASLITMGWVWSFSGHWDKKERTLFHSCDRK